MPDQDVLAVLKNLDQRVTRIEQYLPALATREELHVAIQSAVAPLATKEELRAAIEPLATKEELRAAIAPLATRVEMHEAIREEGDRTRRHFDVVAESLRDDIRLVAEGVVGLGQRMDLMYVELKEADAKLDVRVTRLEAAPRRRR